jgi:hypothetical protein
MHKLEEHFANLVRDGLRRRGLRKCSDWAERYIYLPDPVTKEPKPCRFEYHPWSKGMHNSECDFNIGMKAAQMAYTNTVLHVSLYELDMKGRSVLYVLPNSSPDASDFSASRFDMMLELSPHLGGLFSDTKNVGHKRAGSRNFWLRGSRSTSGLKNIDPSFVALDEFDEMDMNKVELALRRSDGQWSSRTWCISTPTMPDQGIHRLFMESTQEHWMFRCPHCSKIIELTYPDCLVIAADDLYDEKIKDTHVRCPECKVKITEEEKRHAQNETGLWVPMQTGRIARGFHVNQLSSCVKPPWKIAQTALKARYSQSAEQELYNSLMGMPHICAGSKLTETEVDACLTPRRMSEKFRPTRFRTMGVDIGKVHHYEIAGWHLDKIGPDVNLSAHCQVIKAGLCESFQELAMLFRQYQIMMCVLDWQPESEKVFEFCCNHGGRANRCQYASGQGGKKLTIVQPESERKLMVHRTHWIDLALGRVRTGRIELPADIPIDYKAHLRNLVKFFKSEDDEDVSKDKSEYRRQGADHYAHARTYNEIALPLVASMASNQNVRAVL